MSETAATAWAAPERSSASMSGRTTHTVCMWVMWVTPGCDPVGLPGRLRLRSLCEQHRRCASQAAMVRGCGTREN